METTVRSLYPRCGGGVAVSEWCDTELVGMGNDAAVVKTAGTLEDEDRFI